jgi:hypothetical protein
MFSILNLNILKKFREYTLNQSFDQNYSKLFLFKIILIQKINFLILSLILNLVNIFYLNYIFLFILADLVKSAHL